MGDTAELYAAVAAALIPALPLVFLGSSGHVAAPRARVSFCIDKEPWGISGPVNNPSSAKAFGLVLVTGGPISLVNILAQPPECKVENCHLSAGLSDTVCTVIIIIIW